MIRVQNVVTPGASIEPWQYADLYGFRIGQIQAMASTAQGLYGTIEGISDQAKAAALREISGALGTAPSLETDVTALYRPVSMAPVGAFAPNGVENLSVGVSIGSPRVAPEVPPVNGVGRPKYQAPVAPDLKLPEAPTITAFAPLIANQANIPDLPEKPPAAAPVRHGREKPEVPWVFSGTAPTVDLPEIKPFAGGLPYQSDVQPEQVVRVAIGELGALRGKLRSQLLPLLDTPYEVPQELIDAFSYLKNPPNLELPSIDNSAWGAYVGALARREWLSYEKAHEVFAARRDEEQTSQMLALAVKNSEELVSRWQTHVSLSYDLMEVERDIHLATIEAADLIRRLEFSKVGADVENYLALTEAHLAKTRQFESHVARQEVVAAANNTTARAFEAAIEAKTIDVQTLRADLDLEKQKIDAMAAEIAAKAGALHRAEADLALYEHEIQKWLIQLENAKSAYTIHSIEAEKTTALNRLDIAKLERHMADTQKHSADEMSKAAENKSGSNLTEKVNAHAGVGRLGISEVKNFAASAKAAISAAQQEMALVGVTVQNQIAATNNAGNAAAADVSGHGISELRKLRMSTLSSLQALAGGASNVQAGLFGAVGRAAGAVAAGEFSGIRASQSIGADYDVKVSDAVSHTDSARFSFGVTERDSWVEEESAI